GKIIVMEPDQYQSWLAGNQNTPPGTLTTGTPAASIASGSDLASIGANIFQGYGCNSCHEADNATGKGVGPSLVGIYGSTVTLDSGSSVQADDDYIRESILYPNRKVVAGYKPIMPTYDEELSEAEITDLIAYIKSLAQEAKR